MNTSRKSLFEFAYRTLLETSPERKCSLTRQIYTDRSHKQLSLEETEDVVSLPDVGRPPQPKLISPRNLKQRSMHTKQGRLALMHAIAHIEFNAINLALDAVYRFRDMPEQYYDDWVKVADDEARHFALISQYLESHSMRYGDLPAHNGLWDMALKTEQDVLKRMALVPRVMEARGLDVTPRMIESFDVAGDTDAVSVLNTIYQEEITHVEIGNRWFQYCCQQRGLNPRITFKRLIGEYFSMGLRGPYNLQARLQAGFDREELEELFGS